MTSPELRAHARREVIHAFANLAVGVYIAIISKLLDVPWLFVFCFTSATNVVMHARNHDEILQLLDRLKGESS